MGLIEKIETLINRVLLFIAALFVRLLVKITPTKVQVLLARIHLFKERAIVWLKALPRTIIESLPLLISKTKGLFQNIDFKSKLQETRRIALEQYALSQQGNKISELKKAILTPFLIFGQWLRGLTTTQTLVLMSFTAASVLASINIIFSGNRMMNQHMAEGRAPASVEEEIPYDRPVYYKKQSRHLEINSLRLPVYFANVNDLRTIDVDFTATLSNRRARMQLEKLEFQLRDHLIIQVEPMVASFPLEEEGKIILREKIFAELSDFMIQQNVEGTVKDVKLIYILAN